MHYLCYWIKQFYLLTDCMTLCLKRDLLKPNKTLFDWYNPCPEKAYKSQYISLYNYNNH